LETNLKIPGSCSDNLLNSSLDKEKRAVSAPEKKADNPNNINTANKGVIKIKIPPYFSFSLKLFFPRNFSLQKCLGVTTVFLR
jgi:hypothetical protein